MALKSWNEMAKVDVTPYIEKRKDEQGNEFDYMPWIDTLLLLHENGAEEVSYGVIPSATGHSVHMTEQGFTDKNGAVNHCPEVHVWVKIDGKRFPDDDPSTFYNYPIRSGSFVIRDMTMNQHRVDVAITRAVCKCIAIYTGLGINLWKKNDETEAKPEMDIIAMQSATNLFKKLGTEVTELIRDYGLSEAEIAVQMGLDTDRIGDVIKVDINRLRGYEQALEKIKKNASKA